MYIPRYTKFNLLLKWIHWFMFTITGIIGFQTPHQRLPSKPSRRISSNYSMISLILYLMPCIIITNVKNTKPILLIIVSMRYFKFHGLNSHLLSLFLAIPFIHILLPFCPTSIRFWIKTFWKIMDASFPWKQINQTVQCVHF